MCDPQTINLYHELAKQSRIDVWCVDSGTFVVFQVHKPQLDMALTIMQVRVPRDHPCN